MEQETHKWSKHTCWGAQTHTWSSLPLQLKQTKLVTEICKACQRLTFYIKVEYSFAPRKPWFRIVKLKEKMRICFSFYVVLHAVPVPLLQSSPWISSTPTRVKMFIPSVHLNSNISNISFPRLTYYSKESGRTKEKLAYSLSLLAIILNIILLNSFGNATLQMEGSGIPSIQWFELSLCLTSIYFCNYQTLTKHVSFTTEGWLFQAKKSFEPCLWFYTLQGMTNLPICYTFYALKTYVLGSLYNREFLDVRHWTNPESFSWGGRGWKGSVVREKWHSLGVPITPVLRLSFLLVTSYAYSFPCLPRLCTLS